MDAKKPKGFREFDSLMRKLMSVPPTEMRTPMEQVSAKEIANAIATLSRSERGRQAMNDLFCLLDNGATSLDQSGQVAVLTLVAAGFGSTAGTSIDAMRSALAKNDG